MMRAAIAGLGLVAIGLALVLFGPREPVDREITFDAGSLPEDLDAYLAAAEARVADLRAGVERRIHWAGTPGTQTPLSVVYLHGFSASSEEIRPVPDRVAAALGANLHYARLTGHGRDGAAMAEATAGAWIEDTAEALAIGRRIGGRVLVLSTSTGGTLAALAAQDPALARDLAGVVLVSPNFRIHRADAPLLTLPWSRHWLPWIAGATRGFEPVNADHARAWTVSYPTEAVVPMAALVRFVAGLDFAAAAVPALFVYSEEDEVVDPAATAAVFAEWGGPKRRVILTMGPEDDPGAHVIAGDIVSPGQTGGAVAAILDWAGAL